MPFSPGELCCVSKACVLLDTDVTSDAASSVWDLIPHVTNISFNQTANSQKLVTSSTGGRETSACGTVTQTGTLEIACHNGTAPKYLCVNNTYRIRWSHDCDYIWDRGECEPFFGPLAPGTYFEAVIRITSFPSNFNIQGNAPIIYTYNFDIIGWAPGGAPEDNCQASEITGGDVFVHCD